MAKKGEKHRQHSKEFKLMVVEMNLHGGQSFRELGRQYELNTGLIHKWVKTYLTEGLDPPPICRTQS